MEAASSASARQWRSGDKAEALWETEWHPCTVRAARPGSVDVLWTEDGTTTDGIPATDVRAAPAQPQPRPIAGAGRGYGFPGGGGGAAAERHRGQAFGVQLRPLVHTQRTAQQVVQARRPQPRQQLQPQHRAPPSEGRVQVTRRRFEPAAMPNFETVPVT
eukprot:TRINITY_DN1254_c0_g1_i1.p4 TRINITY_DN1254_c0_g1~~TRINITY_DN1254_c0_g1_i1.p4  ORF type:complete len:160 (+),score=42.71 TRINITY_DN1254_c0_g1_i1:969-1448(+)